MPKSSLLKNSSDTLAGGGDKRVHTFTNSISFEMNIIMQIEFEITNLEAVVQHFSYYSTRTSPLERGRFIYKTYTHTQKKKKKKKNFFL